MKKRVREAFRSITLDILEKLHKDFR